MPPALFCVVIRLFFAIYTRPWRCHDISRWLCAAPMRLLLILCYVYTRTIMLLLLLMLFLFMFVRYFVTWYARRPLLFFFRERCCCCWCHAVTCLLLLLFFFFIWWRSWYAAAMLAMFAEGADVAAVVCFATQPESVRATLRRAIAILLPDIMLCFVYAHARCRWACAKSEASAREWASSVSRFFDAARLLWGMRSGESAALIFWVWGQRYAQQRQKAPWRVRAMRALSVTYLCCWFAAECHLCPRFISAQLMSPAAYVWGAALRVILHRHGTFDTYMICCYSAHTLFVSPHAADIRCFWYCFITIFRWCFFACSIAAYDYDAAITLFWLPLLIDSLAWYAARLLCLDIFAAFRSRLRFRHMLHFAFRFFRAILPPCLRCCFHAAFDVFFFFFRLCWRLCLHVICYAIRHVVLLLLCWCLSCLPYVFDIVVHILCRMLMPAYYYAAFAATLRRYFTPMPDADICLCFFFSCRYAAVDAARLSLFLLMRCAVYISSYADDACFIRLMAPCYFSLIFDYLICWCSRCFSMPFPLFFHWYFLILHADVACLYAYYFIRWCLYAI